MPPKHKNATGENEAWVSRSQRKRDSAALQQIAEDIARMSPGEWEEFPLTQDFLQALRELRRINEHGARRRQLQYLGRLMRGADGAAVAAVLASRRK